jgi:hypothetical protein
VSILPLVLLLVAAETHCTGPLLDLDAVRMGSACDVEVGTLEPRPLANQLRLEVAAELTVEAGSSIEIPVTLRNTTEIPVTFVLDPGTGHSIALAGVTRDGEPVPQDYCPIHGFGMKRTVQLTLDPDGTATASLTWWANNANENPATASMVGCKRTEGLKPGTYELLLRLPGTRDQPEAPTIKPPVVVR